MDNRGLCCTCSSDKSCSFPRRFPVLHCEEFDCEEKRKNGRLDISKKRVIIKK